MEHSEHKQIKQKTCVNEDYLLVLSYLSCSSGLVTSNNLPPVSYPNKTTFADNQQEFDFHTISTLYILNDWLQVIAHQKHFSLKLFMSKKSYTFARLTDKELGVVHIIILT